MLFMSENSVVGSISFTDTVMPAFSSWALSISAESLTPVVVSAVVISSSVTPFFFEHLLGGVEVVSTLLEGNHCSPAYPGQTSLPTTRRAEDGVVHGLGGRR